MFIRFVSSVQKINFRTTKLLYKSLFGLHPAIAVCSTRNMSQGGNKQSKSIGSAETEEIEDPTAFYQVRKQRVSMLSQQ